MKVKNVEEKGKEGSRCSRKSTPFSFSVNLVMKASNNIRKTTHSAITTQLAVLL